MFELTQKWLHDNLAYDESTGVFTWKVRPAMNIKAGSVAGRKDKQGRWGINIKNKKYSSSRLVWLYVHGVWPPDGLQVDHINRNPGDNRLVNLRCVTGSENCMNRTYRHGINGEPRHASFLKKANKWQAQAMINQKLHYFGVYETFEEARQVSLSNIAAIRNQEQTT